MGEKITGLWPLVKLLLQVISQSLGSPEFLVWMALAMLLVYWQYRRQAAFVRDMWGQVAFSAWQETLDSLVAGVFGGLLAGLFLIGLGISLSDSGILYLWPLALLLMFFHPRYLCFSYGGGLLALWKLLTGDPASVHVPALVGLVAVLHGVEAFLIAWMGASKAQPVYVRRPEGKTVGGYLLQRLWPIPTLGISLVWVAQSQLAGLTDALKSVPTPSWWPLLAGSAPAGSVLGTATGSAGNSFSPVLIVLPIVAALGYSDLTITQLPQAKAKRSAQWLGLYSVALLGLALAAQYGGTFSTFFSALAALAMPLGHEAVIYLGQHGEVRRTALFAVPEGDPSPLRIMAVMPGSPAAQLGLQVGDALLRVNGEPVSAADQLRQLLASSVGLVAEIQRGDKRVTLEYSGRAFPLGIVLTPSPEEQVALPLVEDTFFDGIRRWLGRRVGGQTPPTARPK
ncbi:MAG: PDZ domain-containing protein [Limnochordaceae bacterium]|nr:PDZ domain-containing protein [Limnochordaceae bacterium]